MITRDTLQYISHIATPFYFYDIALLRKTLATVTSEANKYGFKVHYALKANNDARILAEARGYGLGADCVSGGEVRASIEAGFSPQSIVFAGVGKSDQEIAFAIEQGIYAFNIESLEELEVVNSLAMEAGKTVTIALRINPDVDPQTHQNISTGKADTKFGISYNEIDLALEKIDSLHNVEITGLHFHIGSQITQLKVFEYLCKRVMTISDWFLSKGIHLTHLNVGGGLGINYDNPRLEPIPNFSEYFKIFATHLTLREGQTLHFELGRSITGQCGTLISKVLYNKVAGNHLRYVIIDASMTELIRPALYGAKHEIVNLSSTLEPKTYHVAGGVCESSDVFARDIELPETHRGDILALRSAGAYGQSMSSQYNLRDLPSSVYSDEVLPAIAED